MMRVPGGGSWARGTPDIRASMSLAPACTAFHLASSVCSVGEGWQMGQAGRQADRQESQIMMGPGWTLH